MATGPTLYAHSIRALTTTLRTWSRVRCLQPDASETGDAEWSIDGSAERNCGSRAVGFGTCQLRLVPRAQAIDTLLKGFDLGVNIVHTAPDYGTAEEIVAEALTHTGAKVIVASQGYDVPGNSDGPVAHFERLFETTCERLGTDRLDLYGIACIDDRECHRENVWGRQGMVEFLLTDEGLRQAGRHLLHDARRRRST